MFRRAGKDLYRFAGGRGSNVNGALLYAPDPECEETIKYRVDDDCDGGVQFGGLKS